MMEYNLYSCYCV